MLLLSFFGFTVLLAMLYTKNIKQYAKLLNVVFNTLKSRLLDNPLSIEMEKINNIDFVKYGELYLSTLNSHHIYDIKCFNIPENIHDETRDYYLDEENIKFLPLNLTKYKNQYITSPFRPIEYKYPKLYIAIKKVSEQLYSVYKFNVVDYVNILDVIEKYEVYLKAPKEEVLAEAFD